MECEFCDCTGSTKLPGRLVYISTNKSDTNFMDIGRIKLNRKREYMKAIRSWGPL